MRKTIILLLLLLLTSIVNAGVCPDPTEISSIPDLTAGQDTLVVVETENQAINHTINLDVWLEDEWGNTVTGIMETRMDPGDDTFTFTLHTTSDFVEGEYKLNVRETRLEFVNDTVGPVEDCTQRFTRTFYLESPRKTYSELDMAFTIKDEYLSDRVNQTALDCQNGYCASYRIELPRGYNASLNITNEYNYTGRDWSSMELKPYVSWNMFLDSDADRKKCVASLDRCRALSKELNKTLIDTHGFVDETRDLCLEVRNESRHVKLDYDEIDRRLRACMEEKDRLDVGFLSTRNLVGIVLTFIAGAGSLLGFFMLKSKMMVDDRNEDIPRR